jgi:hypothetical protein
LTVVEVCCTVLLLLLVLLVVVTVAARVVLLLLVLVLLLLCRVEACAQLIHDDLQLAVSDTTPYYTVSSSNVPVFAVYTLHITHSSSWSV